MEISTIIYGVFAFAIVFTAFGLFSDEMAANYGVTLTDNNVSGVTNAVQGMKDTTSQINEDIQTTTTSQNPVDQVFGGLSALTNTLKFLAFNIPNYTIMLITGIFGFLKLDDQIYWIIVAMVTAIVVIAVVSAIRRWYM
jgi:hypothetical protein